MTEPNNIARYLFEQECGHDVLKEITLFSYAQFLEKERGMVRFKTAALETSHEYSYQPYVEEIQDHGLMQNYDPEKEFVLMIERADGTYTFIYRPEDPTLHPKYLYEQSSVS